MNTETITFIQNELSKSCCSPLTPSETLSLLSLSRTTGPAAEKARERLVNANRRLVYYLASRFCGDRTYLIPDCYQEGIAGLIKAIDMFDASVSSNFAAYASRAINSSIADAYNNNKDLVRTPQNIQKYISLIRKANQAYLDQHGTLPSEYQLEKLTGLSSIHLRRALDAMANHTISIDKPVLNNADTYSLDTPANHCHEKLDFAYGVVACECDEAKAAIFKTFCELTLQGFSNSEIAKELNISTKTLHRRVEEVRSVLARPQVVSLFNRLAA